MNTKSISGSLSVFQGSELWCGCPDFAGDLVLVWLFLPPHLFVRVANSHASGVTLTLSASISRSHARARNVTPKSIFSPLNPLIFCWWLDNSVLMTGEEFRAHSCNICLQRSHCSILWSLIRWKPCTWYISCVWIVQREFRAQVRSRSHWCAFESLDDNQGK